MEHPLRDLIISATEINNHHGVGILLQRFFPDSGEVLTLRSLTVYGGEETFGTGHHELKSANLTLGETEARLTDLLGPYRIRRILCVPYYREDFIHGILARKLTNAPLCTYIMDDQNIFSPKVPDHWVKELLSVSKICFGISPELCAAYQHKYHTPFHLLPPVVESSQPLIPCYWKPDPILPLKAAMIGNVWTGQRLLQLRALLKAVGLQVDWYGNGPAANWLPGTPEEWEEDNLFCLGYLAEEDLVAALAAYPFVIVPSGTLDQDDDNVAFSRLSLPSRLIFLHTRTDTPVLLLGSEDTSAGRFVLHLGTGLCSGYEPSDLRQKLTGLTAPATRQNLREAIRRWSAHLVLPRGGEWLWGSLEIGSPLIAAFHPAFRGIADDRRWLTSIAASQSKPNRSLPVPGIPINNVNAPAFAFLRHTHLDLLRAAGIELPEGKDTELTQLLERLVGYLVSQLVRPGSNILILGANLPAWAATLPKETRGWLIRHVDNWQQTGFPSDPKQYVPVATGPIELEPPGKFDLIVSSCWLDRVKTLPELRHLSSYLDGHTAVGGWNLHAVTAVLHPDYFWTTLAHDFLRDHWELSAWPDLDEILASPDLFTMNETSYAKYWEPTSGKSYREFGRPLGRLLLSLRGIDRPGLTKRVPPSVVAPS